MCVGQRCWPSRQFHLTICRWIQQHTNLFLHQFHNKNGTYLSRIAKGGSSIKATQSMLIPNRLRECSVGFSFNVALHACLHSVKGMGQVACKQSTQKSCWNSSHVCRGIIVWEFRLHFNCSGMDKKPHVQGASRTAQPIHPRPMLAGFSTMFDSV